MNLVVLLIVFLSCTFVNAQDISGKYQLISTRTKEGIVVTQQNKDSVMKALAPRILSSIENESKRKLTAKEIEETMQAGAFYYNNLFEEAYYLTATDLYFKEGLDTETGKVKTLREGDYSFDNKTQKIVFYGKVSYLYTPDIHALYDSILGTISCFSDTTDSKPFYIKDVYKKVPNDKRTKVLFKFEPDSVKMALQSKYFPADFTSLYIGANEAYVSKRMEILNNQNSRYGIKKVTRQERDDIVYLYAFEFKDNLNDAQINDYLNLRYGKYNNKDTEYTWAFNIDDGTRLIIWLKDRKLYICDANNF